MNKKPLEALKNKSLSAVIFILDYLQIQFDSAVITFLIYPKVEMGNKHFSFGESEYRNKICELIGETISDVIFSQDNLFCLDFGEGKIYCSIAPEDYISPEMVIVDDGNGNTIVF